jgi:hypothetical protein
MAKKQPPPRRGKRLIFRASKTVGGKTLYAKDYGYKAWPIWV